MGAVTWRGIRQHPVRFALSIIAVVLGIAFVSGTFSLRTVLATTFDEIISTSTNADAYVQPAGTGKPEGPVSAGVRIDLAPIAATAPGVDQVVPTLQGPVVLVGSDQVPVSSPGADSIAEAPMNPRAGKIIEGAMPKAAGEIALEEATAKRAGLKVGATTQIVLGSDVKPEKVVGIARLNAVQAGATIVFIDYDSALKAFAPDGTVPSIAIYGKPGVATGQLAMAVNQVLNAPDTQVADAVAVRQAAMKNASATIGFVTAFLLIFALIALIVGGFIIANTFSMVVRGRTREIAILRAIGASPGQVMRSVLTQAAVVGLVGAAIGVVTGIALVWLIRLALAALNLQLSSVIPLDAAGVITGVVLGVATATIAAIWPARVAARIPPVEAMREDAAERVQRGWLRPALGAGLLIGGIALLWYCLSLPDNAGIFLAVAAVLIIAGAIAIAPVVARPFLSVLAVLPVAAIPPLGKLAKGNVLRQPRRTANTAGALMIGMALVASAAVLAASTHASVAAVVQRDVKADFILQSQQWLFPSAALDTVKQLPHVGTVDELRQARMKVDTKDTLVYADSQTLFTKSMTPSVVSGKVSALSPGQAMVTEAYAKAHGVTVGQSLLAEPNTPGHAQAPNPESVVAIIASSTLGNAVIIAHDDYDKNVATSQQRTTIVLVTGKAGTDTTQLRGEITKAVQPYYVINVLDPTQYTNQFSAQVDRILVLVYALLALSILIAFLGVINTLALSVTERTREIGLMRAVGLGRGQQAGIVMIESVLIAIFGTLVGLAIGVGLSVALQRVFAGQGLSQLAIPWLQLGIVLAAAIVVAILAALGPALKAARLPVLKAINYR